MELAGVKRELKIEKQSTLVISKSKEPMKHFKISLLRYIRFVELMKYESNNQVLQMSM